jgi:MFS family permease
MCAFPAVKQFSLHIRRGLPPLQRGQEWYVASYLINALGSGLFNVFSLLYFHQVVGLPYPLVGLGLTLATGMSLVTVPILGTLMDRFGARPLLISAHLLRAVGFLAYLVVHSFIAFLPVATLVAIGNSNSTSAVNALVAEMAAPEDRDRWYGLSRTLVNAGLGAGGLLGGVAAATAGTAGYRWIVVLNALSFVVAAGMLVRLRTPSASTSIPPALPAATWDAEDGRAKAGTAAGYGTVLRDRPFLSLVGVSVLLWIANYSVDVALAPYVVSVLHASAWMAGVLFALNTSLVVLVQVPIVGLLASRRRTRAMMAGGLGYAAAFVCLAVALLVPAGLLLVYLCATIVLATTAEVVQAPSIPALATAVAPVSLRGRYLALSSLSLSTAIAITPLLATWLLVASPAALWLTLAPLMLVAVAAVAVLERFLPVSALRAPRIAPRSQVASTTRPSE